MRTGVPVRDALDSALVALRAAGIDTPRLDAEILLADVLGVERSQLVTGDLEVTGAHVRAFQDAVRRRAVEREPVAYIVGRRGFRHLDLTVDDRVLIPRPETELLVELALGALRAGAAVVDVGTGSGAVALALASERPDLRVSGSDLSPDALAVARANGARLAIPVTWLEADGLPPGDWDAVVSNPPYVADGEQLAPEIARHEPAQALFAGPDGLAVLRAVVAQAAAAGVAWIALEHGSTQGEAVRELLRAAGYEDAASHRDLAGHERVSTGARAG